MGIYLNPKNENFKRTLASDIYVDKTMMLDVLNAKINKGDNYICMSRPRRFGKTIASNMLAAYYSKGCDSQELFKDLKISSVPGYKENLNKYNVIKIDLNSEYQNTNDRINLIDRLSKKILDEMRKEFPDTGVSEDDSLAEGILKAYDSTGDTFIIIIDEYDVLVREQVEVTLFKRYLSFLNGLFKSDTLRPAISLAYLTGILPVVRDKVQSKLNNFKEYTIINAREFAGHIGFTDEEVRALCGEYGVDFDKCKLWYDGYRLNGTEIYNPESVVESMLNHSFGGYWNKTSTYAVITDYLEQDFDSMREDVIRMIAGENVEVNITSYMNTMDSFRTKDDVFTYLIHIGYLAYECYDDMYPMEGFCRIPNNEVRQEWKNAVAVQAEYKTTDKIIKASKQLLRSTVECDEEAVSAALDVSHINVTSNRSYNNEDALQSAIYLAYIYALNEYNCIKEMTTGKGFADVVYIPVQPSETRPAMVIELKRNKTAQSGLDQIRQKKYFESLSQYNGNLLLVGINYDEANKTHSCKIEKYEKYPKRDK